MKKSTTGSSVAILISVLIHGLSLNIAAAQGTAFEVATIKQAAPDDRGGRYLTMQGAHQFIAKNYSLKYMVAAAYNLNPRAVSGGADWTDSIRYDIRAVTPGESRPSLDQQMSMLRAL